MRSLYLITILFLVSFIFPVQEILADNSVCDQACIASQVLGPPISVGCCSSPYESNCYTIQEGERSGTCSNVTELPSSCVDTQYCEACGPGYTTDLRCENNPNYIYLRQDAHRDIFFYNENACSDLGVNYKCYCYEAHLGTCAASHPGGGCISNGLSCSWNSDCCSAYCRPEAPRVCQDPPPVPSCAIQNLSCPSVCEAGKTFNVSYDYRNTDYLIKPNISQRIVDWNYNNLWCLADQTVYDNAWHSVTRSVPCPNTSMTIFLGGHSDAGHWTDWCNTSWNYAGIADGTGCIASCQIEVIPPAIGYVKIKHPLGILSLRLISFSDALSFLKGIFKVSRFGGDTNASADLVETTDPNASPVRVKTPYGIKAWRMSP